jgi:hypothetical protein
MKRMQSSELNKSTQSLALIMPLTIEQVVPDQDEDKCAMQIIERPIINYLKFYFY